MLCICACVKLILLYVITNYTLQSVALFNSCRRLVTVISLTPFHVLVVPKDVFITQFIKDVADPHSEAIIFLGWDLLKNVQFSWTFSCLVTVSCCGGQLGWVKKLFSRLDCNCVTGSKLSCLCIGACTGKGWDSSLGRGSDWKTRHSTDVGSSPQCDMGFFSPNQLPVQTLTVSIRSPCASSSVCTLKIPDNDSHTIVWTHENTTLPSWPVGMCSAAPAAAVLYPGKATCISHKVQWSTEKHTKKLNKLNSQMVQRSGGTCTLTLTWPTLSLPGWFCIEMGCYVSTEGSQTTGYEEKDEPKKSQTWAHVPTSQTPYQQDQTGWHHWFYFAD